MKYCEKYKSILNSIHASPCHYEAQICKARESNATRGIDGHNQSRQGKLRTNSKMKNNLAITLEAFIKLE